MIAGAEDPVTSSAGFSVSGVVAVAGHHGRRNLAAHVVLGVLTGLALAVAVGALATARRTATVYDRLVEASGTADYRVALFGGVDLAGEVSAAPGVRASWPATAGVARLDGFGVVYLSVETGPTAADGVVETVVTIGRDIAPEADDEVVIAQPVAVELGLQPGDELTLSFLTPAEMLQFDTGFGDPDGPRVVVRVVGISRAAGVRARTAIVAGPAFAERYGDDISVGTALYVDLEPGAASQTRFLRAVDEIVAAHDDPAAGPAEFAPIELSASNGDRAAYAATARVLDIGQLVAAAIVLAGTLVAVVQVLGRRHRAARADQLTEDALGLSRSERTAARALGALPAAVVAAGITGAGVLLAGTFEPLGALADLEPNPGWAPHAGLAVAGAATAGVLVLGASTWGAWRAGRRQRAERRPSNRAKRWSAVRTLGSPPVAVGVALALDAAPEGAGATGSVPTRASAFLVGAGLAGLAAVLTFGASLDRLVSSPDRWGFTADISVIDANDAIVAALVEDPDVGQLSLLSVNQLHVDGINVHAYAVDPIGDSDLGWTVLDGRRPRHRGEVMLGRRILDDLGARTGDTIELRDGARLTIVGTGVGPALNGEALGASVLVTAERLSISGETTGFREALVSAVAPGRAAPLIADLAERYEVMVRQPPNEVANLDQLGRLPDLLAASLAAIATVALLHSLISTARRRSTFDVLRALGFTTRDMVATVLTSGLTIVGLGLVVGIPIGLGVGRLVWWAVADSVAVATDVSIPVPALVVVAAGAVAVAAATAAIPALRLRKTAPIRSGRGEGAPP